MASARDSAIAQALVVHMCERPQAMAMCLNQCDGSVRDRFAACLDRVCGVYAVRSGCVAPVGFDDARAVPL